MFFMMEFSEVFFPSWSCLGTLGGLARAAGRRTGETERGLVLRREEERIDDNNDKNISVKTILLAGAGLALTCC